MKEARGGEGGGGGAVVVARGLRKTYRDFWGRAGVEALGGISFVVGGGSVYGLLGPNGSGKSTTIKLLLGLLRPSGGTLEVFGKAAGDLGVKGRIGYLPEESHLYRALTPEEALWFQAELFRMPRAVRRERVEQLLAMTGLAHVRDRAIGGFSKGMARRVGLAQALVNDPDLLILDEPTGGLDPEGTRQVKDLILALGRRGKTVLVTSHLLADVEEICGRVAILYGGRILAEGTLGDLLTRGEETTLTFPTPVVGGDLDQLLAQAKEVLGAVPVVSHPKRGLEEYFLGIIRAAAGVGGPMPSGAAQGERGPAPFLVGR